MENITVAVAIITGLTEVVKRLGVSTRYIPAIAVLLGAGYGVAVAGLETTAIIGGIVAGLTAVGLYRTAQKTLK